MFNLTKSAKEAIRQHQKGTDELMPMITWVTDGNQQGGEWELGGFIEKAAPNIEKLRRQKGATFFFEVSEIEFVVDGPMHFLNLLKEATLDYANGIFVILADRSQMSIDAITRELIDDCLSRISAGDPSAAFDLASTFMSHVDAKDVGLNLAIIEALATLAKLQGCSEAANFLREQWPDMKVILGKRWQRAGFEL